MLKRISTSIITNNLIKERMEKKHKEYDNKELGDPDIKLIIIGDTACGKSK